MELNVKERVLILGLLPAQGDILTLKIVRTLQNELSFSEEENKVLSFVQNNGVLNWDPDQADKLGKKKIKIGEIGKDLVATALKEKNDKNLLHMDCIELYEKFVIEKK